MKNKKNLEEKIVVIRGDDDEKLKKYAAAPYFREKNIKAGRIPQKTSYSGKIPEIVSEHDFQC